MMQLSNVLSDFVLSVTAIFVFFRFCANLPLHNRLAWATFLVIVAMAAAAGVLRFLGIERISAAHDSLTLLAGTAGIAGVVVGIGAAALRVVVPRWVLGLMWAAGFTLFVVLFGDIYRPFVAVVSSLGMLVGMILAVYGVFQKQQKLIWVIVGIMIVGIATKIVGQHLPLSPTDVYHYSLALAIYCFGKGIEPSHRL
jgi:hypothetical protein